MLTHRIRNDSFVSEMLTQKIWNALFVSEMLTNVVVFVFVFFSPRPLNADKQNTERFIRLLDADTQNTERFIRLLNADTQNVTQNMERVFFFFFRLLKADVQNTKCFIRPLNERNKGVLLFGRQHSSSVFLHIPRGLKKSTFKYLCVGSLEDQK